ncbi:MAG: sulfurtransferase [Pseudonocardiales bacterium]|nr:sulfurtransferase [Pseudonocardiales bacterium]
MISPTDQLVDPAWLAAHLADPDLVVVDCRFAGGREASRQTYRDGHIAGAAHVYWLDELCAADTRVTSLLPDPARAADGLGRLGIGPDAQVVGYADNANLYAARLWHVLREVGHRWVRLLDGGIDAWRDEGRELVTGDRAVAPVTYPLPEPQHTTIDRDELHARLADTTLQLIDTRSAAEYDGTERRAARGGHIPGAVLLPWTELTDTAGRYLGADAIRARCRAAGLDPACEVVTYCQGGVRAAHAALALQMAGFHRVRIYDGSWAQWGNDLSLPITTSATSTPVSA